MAHYILNPPQPKQAAINRERWEAFAGFLTFAALVALAGATYGALRRGDVYAEVSGHPALQHFAGMLESSPALARELEDKSKDFTVIAPSDVAFRMQGVAFLAEREEAETQDKRIIRVEDDGDSYILRGEGYVVRSYILPHDVPTGEPLHLPAASGDLIAMGRSLSGGETVITVNGIPVRERVVADNGVIYIVDTLIHPLPLVAEEKTSGRR